MPFSGEFRGAVLLAPGIFNISGTIMISGNGIVLRGSGSGLKDDLRSTIKLTGKPFNAITIRANSGSVPSDAQEMKTIKTVISDRYVPSGASGFSVVSTEKFSKGDVILIRKPVTENWIRFMQMDNLVRDGKPQTWLKKGSFLVSERVITEIDGNKIMIDVPLSDSYNSEYTGPQGTIVELAAPSRRIRHCGIENLNIVSPEQPVPHSEPHFTAIRINGEDCWAKDYVIQNPLGACNWMTGCIGESRLMQGHLTGSQCCRKALRIVMAFM